MTASVPLSAPATPPLTGESTPTMPLAASAAAISRAIEAPVVERSSTVFTFEPAMTAVRAQRDLPHDRRVREAEEHRVDRGADRRR